MEKTRKTISVLHLTQKIHKEEKNLCAAFDSKHTKTRKELSVLHWT